MSSSPIALPFRLRFLPLVTSNNSVDDDDNGHRYLIITNISKKPNIKALICSAAAHSFIPLLVAEPNISETDCSLTKPSRSIATSTPSSLQGPTTDDVLIDDDKVSKMVNDDDDVVVDDETSSQFIDVFRCETMEELVQFLTSKHVTVVGIEIMDDAESVMADGTFSTLSRVAFFPGNEGTERLTDVSTIILSDLLLSSNRMSCYLLTYLRV